MIKKVDLQNSISHTRDYGWLNSFIPNKSIIENIGINLIKVNSQNSTSLHSHPQEEVAIIKNGSGLLYNNDILIPFNEGDVLLIPKNESHQFINNNLQSILEYITIMSPQWDSSLVTYYEQKKFKVCFVCLGNICRSPLAEGIFKKIILENNMENEFLISSAGVKKWHIGKCRDIRSYEVAESHNIQLTDDVIYFDSSFMDFFDLVLALDEKCFNILSNYGNDRKKLQYLSNYHPIEISNDIVDPYYGDIHLFELAYQTIYKCCLGLFINLTSKK